MLRRVVLRSATRAQTRGLRDVRVRIHEPEYLSLLEPPSPVHSLINIQLKGYDFPVLEQQERRVAKIAFKLGISIKEVWATPLRSFRVQTFSPQSSTVDQTYDLQIYERNVQLQLVPGFLMGTLIDLLQKNLAEGIKVSVHAHEPEHLEIRQIPDLELEAMERQLQEAVSPSTNPHYKKV